MEISKMLFFHFFYRFSQTLFWLQFEDFEIII